MTLVLYQKIRQKNRRHYTCGKCFIKSIRNARQLLLPPGDIQLIVKKGLSEEVCVHITGNTEIRGVYPHISSRYTVDAGTLNRAAGDLNLLTVLRAFVNYFVLICRWICL